MENREKHIWFSFQRLHTVYS